MELLDGKFVANIEKEKLMSKINSLSIVPKLCIIQVGDLFESQKYISSKMKMAEDIGIFAQWIKFDERISEEELINKINSLQDDFDGMIVQLPLPQHINSQRVLDQIKPEKDIDGLSSYNMKNFYKNNYPYFIPATARAVYLLLEFYKVNLKQDIMVIGESNLVGKPVKHILSEFATHIESRNKEIGIKDSEKYDILIVAAGSANLIKKENVKEGAIIVDVGINTLDNKKVVGDVDFDDVKDKVSAISPVPGGVGPLTVICLFKNLLDKF